ncbi:hypothetical protein ACH5RR_029500 [Cinchona calisaya]|uniref:DUF4283 domain-containing protein n=1 Tax=Cinchona calisaya TaxID=153742 RepID=A0ABD2YV60_9GENT
MIQRRTNNIFLKRRVESLSQPLKLALVGKFWRGKANMATIWKSFQTIGFKGSFALGLLDYKHVLIRFDLEEDYLRCWLKSNWFLNGFQIRVFKWHPLFRPDVESYVVPWISFESFLALFFNKHSIFSFSQAIGRPLKIDLATSTLSHSSLAKMCVQVDLLIEHPSRL